MHVLSLFAYYWGLKLNDAKLKTLTYRYYYFVQKIQVKLEISFLQSENISDRKSRFIS